MSKFAYTKSIDCRKAIFAGDEFQHQIKVLRRKIGDSINFLDGLGRSYQGHITVIDILKKELQVEIIKSETFSQPLPLQLLVAIPKNGKLDGIIQKAVELGVTEFTPLLTSRTVVRVDSDEKIEKKCLHWRRIAIASLKQSGNPYQLNINRPTTLIDLKENLKEKTFPVDRIVFHPRAHDALPVKELELNKDVATRLVFGPEGGFSKDEIDFLRSHSYMIGSLGRRIMRLETAVVSALTLVQVMKDNL